MEITDSPHRPGTPEHNEWVRTVFIPTVNTERMRADRAKYGAEAIGRKLVRPERDAALSKVYRAAPQGVIKLSFSFKDFDRDIQRALGFTLGFSDEEIKRSEDRRRRNEEARRWLSVPGWAWETMSHAEREFLGMVRVEATNGAVGYFDHGRYLPEYGPPKPVDNRAMRRIRTRPPLRPPPLCPKHGFPVYQCGPCQRSSHAAR